VHNDRLVKVENEAGLYRDPASGAIINTNASGLKNYLEARKRMNDSRSILEKHTSDIDSLKNDVSEIKNMLTILIQNSQKRD
jgi:uncharacterized coiled-coil DUF342 family protein